MQSDTQKNRLARRGLPIIQLMVYKRTIRFNADDRVVYQRMRRKMRLASDNSWARHRLKHLNWRSRWIILFTLEWRMAVSCEISRADRCLFILSSWLSTRSSSASRRTWSAAAWLPDNCTRLADSLQQTKMKLPTLHSAAFVHHTALTDEDVLNQNHIFLWNFYDI